MTKPSTDSVSAIEIVCNKPAHRVVPTTRCESVTYPGHDTPRREPTTAATVHRARRIYTLLPVSCRAVHRPSRRH